MSVCLCVAKDLAKRWTDMILLYSVASHRAQVYDYILGEGTTNLPKEIPRPFLKIYPNLSFNT